MTGLWEMKPPLGGTNAVDYMNQPIRGRASDVGGREADVHGSV